MTSPRQITANRLNALRSTGPRTAEGKRRSRQNAWRHGLTAETVITALEDTGDYQTLQARMVAEYLPRTATERELVARLTSVLWRLRRATAIETGLFQMQAELIRKQRAAERPCWTVPPPQWHDELDHDRFVKSHWTDEAEPTESSKPSPAPSPEQLDILADCFLQVGRFGYDAFGLLSRYETALWRQAAQILFMLRSNLRG
jgi:hypothetical protein